MKYRIKEKDGLFYPQKKKYFWSYFVIPKEDVKNGFWWSFFVYNKPAWFKTHKDAEDFLRKIDK